MKKTITFLIMFIVIIQITLIIHAPAAHAENYQAGGTTWTKYTPMSIRFVQNDAYETQIVHYPYEYEATVWDGKNNQRVTVEVQFGDNNGKGPNFGWFTGLAGDAPEARLIQEPDWITDENVTKPPASESDTGWIKAYSWDYQTNDHGFPYWPATAYFTFLTNSTWFKPGFFKVEVKVKISNWIGQTHEETVASIWGHFTYGTINVNDFHDGTIDNYTSMKATVGEGKWHISLWYAGQDGNNWGISQGKLTGSDSKLMKDFGDFTSKDNPVNLRYNFSKDDPTGIYIWLVNSVNKDGEILYSWTETAYNNITTLNHTQKPQIQISFKGQPIINHKIKIVITATDDDSSVITVWITAYYSSNEWQIPDPSTPLVQLFNYRIDVKNGNSSTISILLTNDGVFAVSAIAKDEHGAFNVARNYIAVQGFEGGGGGSSDNTNPWFIFPWENTINIVILLIGVIMMFSGKRELQVLGIILFFASFVNWSYIPTAVSNYIHSKLPHLEVGV